MSASKLGRFAGLLVVLAAMFAVGVGATGVSANRAAVHSAFPHQDLEIVWA
jgi:hypothetical protein